MRTSKQKALFWIAVSISAVFANLWAFWGIMENFHEGWYFVSIWDNLTMMFGQYLSVPLALAGLAAVAIRWNKVGAVLHLLLAIGAYMLFGEMNAGFLFVVVPMCGLALLYWFGKNEKHRLAYSLVLGLPILQILVLGTILYARVSERMNDGNFGARIVDGNGVRLMWAPEGPGWPDKGTAWHDAKRICAHLDSSGTRVLDSAVHIWRLPTVDEAVRSMAYHGKNSGGVWDSVRQKASYRVTPDKETPLWNMHKRTIYWWTATEVDSLQALVVVYNGGVWPRMKKLRAGYQNFRAVRNVP